MSAYPLTGKTALVTGGGRGIGEACARALIVAGGKVCIVGRDLKVLEAVARDTGATALRADLADRADTDRLVAELEAKVGAIDVLVNNAGVAESAPYTATTDEVWDRTLELNATATFRLTRALAPGMVARGWGRIVNIASNAGVWGYAYTAAYCASKHAVVGLTRALAVELGKTGVTVNALCPGWVDTAMADRAIANIVGKTGRSAEEARGALEQMSPQRRLIAPDEVAHVLVMLCAEASRGVHGQTIVIDGGQVQG